MNVLAWDTSGRTLTAVLVRDGRVVASTSQTSTPARTQHTEHLTPALKALMSRASVPFRDLQAVAYVAGPGSFTGLRIGAATAKGISLAWNVPVAALSTTEMIARSLAGSGEAGEEQLVSLDARKGRFYTAVFAIDKGELRRRGADRDASVADVAEMVGHNERIVLSGPGAVQLAQRLHEEHGLDVARDERLNVIQGLAASAIAACREHRWEDADGGPFYLREGDIGVSKRRFRFYSGETGELR